jgi:hypothetical protein
VEEPLLGSDFLKHYKLAVDLASKSLLEAGTMQSVAVGNLVVAGGLAAVRNMPPQLGELLMQFPEVLSKSGKLPPIKHTVTHSIVTTGRPVTAKFRRLDVAKLAAAKKEFLQLEADGIIHRSCSSWASPLHMVPIKDGTWRPCGDYRQLNTVTSPDLYPLPNIGDMSAKLAGCNMFSKIDLRKGYYQIPVAAEDVAKTAVITPFGLFKFLRTPFCCAMRDSHSSGSWTASPPIYPTPFCTWTMSS